MERLITIIKKRRLRRGYDLKLQRPLKEDVKVFKNMSKAKLKEVLESCETERAFNNRCKDYAKKCLKHCEELRAFRDSSKPEVVDVPLPPNDGSFDAVKVRRIPGGAAYKVRALVKELTNG